MGNRKLMQKLLQSFYLGDNQFWDSCPSNAMSVKCEVIHRPGATFFRYERTSDLKCPVRLPSHTRLMTVHRYPAPRADGQNRPPALGSSHGNRWEAPVVRPSVPPHVLSKKPGLYQVRGRRLDADDRMTMTDDDGSALPSCVERCSLSIDAETCLMTSWRCLLV